MVIGAIKTDGLSASVIGTGVAAHPDISGGIDFAAALVAAEAGLGATTTDNAEPAIRTEASRSLAVLGNLQETIIRYTDGTSDIRISTVSTDVPTLTPGTSPIAARPVGAAFRANSDLAPEIGIGGDPTRQLPWRMRPVGRASVAPAAGRKRSGGSVRTLGDQVQAADASHDIGMGRLIDLMV